MPKRDIESFLDRKREREKESLKDRDGRDRDRDSRPSWREIDRKKDRSYYADDGRSERDQERPKVDRWRNSTLSKEFDRLFMGKKGSKEYQDLVVKINESLGTPEFSKLCDKFREENGMPDDWDLLILFLEHDDHGVVEEALKILRPLAAEKQNSKRERLKSQLEILEMTAKTDTLRALVEEILQEL